MKRPPPKHDAQMDLFMPGFTDIAARDANETMELPFFSISKKPRFEPIEYKNETRGIEILITGGKPVGVATIWDKGLRLYNKVRVLPRLRQPRQCGHKLICTPSLMSGAWRIAGYQGANFLA